MARCPSAIPTQLVQELYEAENQGKAEPSGSQDMIGLVYPGVNRLDYDFTHKGGIFPRHIESNNDPQVAQWLGQVIHILPVNQRPEGYNPLETKNLDPDWIARLGQSGQDCYDAIVARDLAALGESLNECMRCWEAILPGTVRHRTIQIDLPGLLRLLSIPLSRRHVLRLRRRLSVRGLRGARAGRVSRQGQNQAVMIDVPKLSARDLSIARLSSISRCPWLGWPGSRGPYTLPGRRLH